MAFYGCRFIFDGIPCEEYGLMIYEFGSNQQTDVSFPSAGEILSDRLDGRYTSLLYGQKQNAPLEFSFTFGINHSSIDAQKPLDRYEIETIASWLTGHNRYIWLEIEQPDMAYIRYKCIISELRLLSSGLENWAFQCKVTCDSPFAYLYPEVFTYQSTPAGVQVNFLNKSSCNGYYRPRLEIATNGSQEIRIQNRSDPLRPFVFDNLPANNTLVISVDNENQVITNSMELNLYPNFSMHFLRLKRGDNLLELIGSCTVKIFCDFPVNAGA